ncbi:MAG: hypothetical protein HYX37_07530 [Rhizobiales bacterium]|nr:hypothetical protein [Hyphomicrobiales bacterium]
MAATMACFHFSNAAAGPIGATALKAVAATVPAIIERLVSMISSARVYLWIFRQFPPLAGFDQLLSSSRLYPRCT